MDLPREQPSPSGPEVDPPIRLRSYQQEMLEWSLKQNIIVVMDTGSGKTHVAIQRIAEELKYRSEADSTTHTKIVWFMCPSVALCMQQYAVLARHLPAYLFKTLFGSDGVDKWTTQELWDGFLMNVKVVVCTPKVLEDALTHGFVKIDGISLMVFDEAHRCIGDSPMNTIMRNFYHPTKLQQKAVPHILGLTASPIMSASSSSLDTIEKDLDAKAITPKVHRSTLQEYVHPPEVLRVSFQLAGDDADMCAPMYHALKRTLSSYDMSSDPWIKHLLSSGNSIYQSQMDHQVLAPSTWCYKQLKTLHQRATHLREQLGSSATEWYIETCIQKCVRSEDYQPVVIFDVSQQERQHLRKILLDIQSASDEARQRSNQVVQATDKVQELLKLLEDKGSQNPRGVIFVEQRATVSALAYLLHIHEPLRSSWNVGTFVGTSNFAGRKRAIADLIDLKEQTQDLEDFRLGTKNLIISTSVLEEGIDVSACNLVVCFDLPKNLVSFIQRRGRAREQLSKYALFIPAQDYKSDPSKWEKLEAEMKQAYMDDARKSSLGEAEVEADTEDDCTAEREYRVPSTGALLTLANAKAHLYHFCAVSTLQASRHLDLRPEFTVRNNGGKTPFSATVTLPSFVHPSLRAASSSRSYGSEALAIKDAAFEAYISLHKEGLINDNLLPLREDPQFTFVNQPSMISIAERENIWKRLFERKTVNSPWYPANLTISHDEQILPSVTMWMPSTLPANLRFDLYWNKDTVYVTRIEPSSQRPLAGSSPELNSVRLFTNTMMRSAHGAHMAGPQTFPVLFSPLNGKMEAERCIENTLSDEKRPRDDLLCVRKDPMECSLVRVRSQSYKPYFFANIKHPNPELEAEIEVKTFPKRKDFLHPFDENNNSHAAYSATYTFMESECSFDNLPAKYAMLATFVPSLMRKLDVAFLAENFQNTVLQNVQIDDLGLVMEAISSPSACEDVDYNRLEFLGDSVLKFCATLQVMGQHLNWPEGYLSRAEDVVVSNGSLTKVALDAGLDRFILTKIFTGKGWRPRSIEDLLAVESESTRVVSSKVVADVVEALIGASYVDGGLAKALDCLRTLMPEQQWDLQTQLLDRLLSDVVQDQRLALQLLEKLVGHEFEHKSLLLQAVTHATSTSPTAMGSYERLEFLGDALLDHIIVPKIFAHPRKLRAWELHRVRAALVNADFLGYCCMKYAFEEDMHAVVFKSPAATDGVPQLLQSTRKVHLHDFIQASAEIAKVKSHCLEAFEKYRGPISQALKHGADYPWPDLTAMRPQKFFSDLIESVLGALFIDTRGDLSVCEAFIARLGIFDVMCRILDEHMETARPKERVGILADGETVEYVPSHRKNEDGVWEFTCAILVGGEEIAREEYYGSQEEADIRAASQAADILQARLEKQDRLASGGVRKNRKLDLIPVDLEQVEPHTVDAEMEVDGGVDLEDDND